MIESESVLTFEGVFKRYAPRGSLLKKKQEDVVALDGVSFSVGRGEIFGLVGESGSGKTTAGRLVVRLEDLTDGTIRLDGSDVAGLTGRSCTDFCKKVQMIFQDPYQSLNPHLSVLDTIAEPLVIHRLAAGMELERRVWAVMGAVGLSPPETYATRYPHQLSGGQRQRVAIARAVVLRPEFLVADEPTSMLDASISAQIFNILKGLRRDMGVSILFITHSLAAARYLCDRIGVIYRGSLMEIGPAASVIHEPRHPYTQALIDALPTFGRDVSRPPYGTLLDTERDFYDRVGCPFFSRCTKAHPVRCGTQRPPLEVGSGNHPVACFYPGDR